MKTLHDERRAWREEKMLRKGITVAVATLLPGVASACSSGLIAIGPYLFCWDYFWF